MSRYTSTWSTVTAAAVADTTTFVAAQAPGFLRAAAGVQLKVNEVYIGGEDTASTPTTMTMARTSTVSVGVLTVGNTTLADATATPPSVTPNWGNTAATTFPQRSATAYLLGLSLNTFGGIARWQARYGEEITIFGATAPLGEVVISSKAGTGKTSGHIIYELV